MVTVSGMVIAQRSRVSMAAVGSGRFGGGELLEMEEGRAGARQTRLLGRQILVITYFPF